MNNKTLAVGLIIFGLFIVALSTRNGDIAWMLLPILVYLGLGLMQTPPVERLRFCANRSLEQRRLNGSTFVDVSLSVQNQADEMIHLSIHETMRPEMKLIDGQVGCQVALQPGETTELKYTFSTERGNYSWESIRTIVSDPLGLIQTELLLPASARIQVWPQIRKFKVISIRPHSTLHSPGSIPARLGGSGTDFYGVREYHPGDSLRRLDWRLNARHPRQFFTKEFEQEEIVEIGLILDARQNTNPQNEEESFFETGVGATASLAEMFLHQGHRVSLLVFGEKMLNAFPGYGKMQLHRIMSCLSKAKVGTENNSTVNLNFIPIRLFPSRALIIIISSLTSSDRSLFLRLRAFGYQTLLISPDPIDFIHPTLPNDISSRLAIRALRLKRRLMLRDIAQLQNPVIDWRVSQPLYPLVRNALTHTRGQREN